MRSIEEFNIDTSLSAHPRFNDDIFKEAVTLAINYQLEEYESEAIKHGSYPDVAPSNFTVYFYPDTYTIEVRSNEDSVSLVDNINNWIQTIKEDNELFGGM